MPAIESPLPPAIRAARDLAGISQTAAASLVHTTCRTWQQWEAGDRKMHPAFWELFQIKTAMRIVHGVEMSGNTVKFG